MRTGEHIVLESDVRELPRPRSPRRVHASLHCRSRLRRQRLSLSIIDYYYLAVRVGQSEATEYVLDLRFIDPSFALTRRIPWHCVWAALALTAAATATSAVWYATDSAFRLRHLVALVSAALIAATALTYVAVAVRLLETVRLYTLHGRAAVLEYRGGAGTLRRFRPFMRTLAAHVQLAATARRTTRAEHLRDELREHHRLKEDGVLPVESYDASKARILAQHCVTGAPSMRRAQAFV